MPSLQQGQLRIAKHSIKMPKTVKLVNKKNTRTTKRHSKNAATSSRPHATRARSTNGRKKVTPALLQEMTRRLVNEFDPEQIILFGSYAWGKPNKDSDVDLMVIVSESDETDQERMVRGYRCLRGLGVPKDVFVKTRAEFDLYRNVVASSQHRIANKGKVLYDKSQKPSDSKMVSDC